MQKKGEIDNTERNDKACDAEAKIEYGNLVYLLIYVNVCWNNIKIYMWGGGGSEYQTNSLERLCSQCIKLTWKAMTMVKTQIHTRCG